jgi:hypothetical protein
MINFIRVIRVIRVIRGPFWTARYALMMSRTVRPLGIIGRVLAKVHLFKPRCHESRQQSLAASAPSDKDLEDVRCRV